MFEYNFAYLGEWTKQLMRHAILKGLALSGARRNLNGEAFA